MVTLEPFRHWVLDNFIPETALRDIMREISELPYPSMLRDGPWVRYQNDCEFKYVLPQSSLGLETPAINQFALRIMSQSHLDKLTELTGISYLRADYGEYGTGLSAMTTGGFLGCHLDFKNHPKETGYSITLSLKRHWIRRLTQVVFLNDAGSPPGGQIEFWDRDARNMVESYYPAPGRCIVFENTDVSYHAVRSVLTGVRYAYHSAYYTAREDTPKSLWEYGYRSRSLFVPNRE